MKFFYAILVSTLILIGLNGCKKYEEGPNFSLRSTKQRVSGEWDITSYTVNNENALNFSFTDNLTCQTGSIVEYTVSFLVTRYVWIINENGDFTSEISVSSQELDDNTSYYACNDYYTYNVTNNNTTGTWKLISDKEKFEIRDNTTGNFLTWEIKELREKQMKLELIDGTYTTKLTLTKR
jgi:hypothetical protein